MTSFSPRARAPGGPQRAAARALYMIERFLHVEAVSGVVLLLAAAVALAWANSPWHASYQAVWHAPVTIGVGPFVVSQSLHFVVNDILMTIFFLVVGMEIRREMHEGALRDVRAAALPVAAALGGVTVPALIYLALNLPPMQRAGWAVPTATDIAFAVGVLALLGRGIPSTVRVFLLALAIIDDIVAVLIIALFYSGGLDYAGLALAAAAIVVVIGMQRLGIGTAHAYVVPGVLLWLGLLQAGAHPTLTGVVLGLMTPVLPRPATEQPAAVVIRVARELETPAMPADGAAGLARSLRDLRIAQRDLLPPVLRVQMALHAWVAYGVMPIFALANAGVRLADVSIDDPAARHVLMGVVVALVVGKPLGVAVASFVAIRAGCRLPEGLDWGGIWLVGLLAGIGFTMSIFIAMLAFADEGLLGAAKLGVLVASVVAGVAGLAYGVVYVRWRRRRGPATRTICDNGALSPPRTPP